MSKTFEFRRHSIKDGEGGKVLGPKGLAYAEYIGQETLRGKRFTHFFVSPLLRTQQTLAGLARGAGDFVGWESAPVPPIYLHTPELKRLWEVCHRAEERGNDMVHAAISFDPGIVRSYRIKYALLFGTWAATLPEGTRALVIGHSPQIEFMAMEISKLKLDGLRECEGYLFKTDGTKCSVGPCPPKTEMEFLRREFFAGTQF